MQAKLQRQQTMIDARRALVLDAARAVFTEAGMEGANIRKIAKRAGYTPGAIYSYFDSKEAIYGALLAESIERLNAAVAQARAVKNKPEKTLGTKVMAWFDFYINNPRDLDLTFYLVQGMKPPGSAVALNGPLQERLHDALKPGEAALLEMGLSPAAAQRESTALFAHGLGLLLLQHTGRTRMAGQSAEALFKLYLEQLIARHSPRPDALEAGMVESATSPQVDLFE